MDQLGSCLSRLSIGTCTRSARPPPGPFLELPVDIILHLCRNHLQPASAVALSLTCKSLFGLISSQAKIKIQLDSLNRETLLLLLEKDNGHRWYYYHNHNALHYFSQDSERYALRSWTSYRDENDCRLRNLASFHRSSAAIGYHHVRLAMNRHFYGPPNGIPLDRFQLQTTPVGQWREQWSARIIEDELFLSATRTLSWTGRRVRDAVDKEDFGMCKHVFSANSSMLQQCAVDALHPTHNVFGSCHKCLTDYDITVEQTETSDQTSGNKDMRVCWSITITSYHRLGVGRSPTDRKWHAFATDTYGFWYPDALQRDEVRYPSGSVWQPWKEAEQFMS
ncbi:hypothetical protein V8F33_011948 [Rhypophila sp. PSN 637]